jgi:nucleotide-binding universal stress UspA family protein
VDFATENDVDLIVMGTLGKTGLSHILLGSVAENVVRHSKRQVLTVP